MYLMLETLVECSTIRNDLMLTFYENLPLATNAEIRLYILNISNVNKIFLNCFTCTKTH